MRGSHASRADHATTRLCALRSNGARSLVRALGRASWRIHRDRNPLRADRFHVIATDLVGIGPSDAPPPSRLVHTFALEAHAAAVARHIARAFAR